METNLDWTEMSVWGDLMRANAAAFGAKPALVGTARQFTFAQINERMNRLCGALGALGLARGDRVAILSRNRPEYIEAYGVAKSGLIAVPLNWRLSPRELLHPLRDSGSVCILAEPEFAPIIDGLRGELEALRHFVGFDAVRSGWLDYEALIAAAPADEPLARVAAEDILCLMYTSGTTGAPKGAMLTHEGLLRNCRTAAEEVLGLTPDDVALAVAPLFHVGGMWYHLFPSLASGCTTVVLSGFDAGAVLDALERHGVTNVHLVPTMIHALLEHPRAKGLRLERLRLMYYAASSIPLEVLRRAIALFADSGFIQSYGSTEAGILTLLPSDDHLRASRDSRARALLASCGWAVAGVELRLADADGKPVPAGSIGEIQARSDRMMAGYWRNDEATRRASAGGWFATGDMGRIDPEGYVTIVDRKHDMIVTGGENVYPFEVEEVLYRDPAVLEAAVFGLPDQKWVEKVAAAVVLRPGSGASEQDIIGRARSQLAGYKCPKTVIFTESLPRTATGKVLKKDLRRMYGAGGA